MNMITTRDEYMTALAMGLKDIDHDGLNDLLNEMDQYFKDGINQGKSEKELCEALGDVDDFIQEFKTMVGNNGVTNHELMVSNDGVSIDVDNGDVTIKMGESFQCNYDPSVFDMISDHDGNNQHIRFESIRKSTISITVVNDLINFLSSSHQIEIVVPGSMHAVNINTENGEIHGDGLTIDTMVLTSKRGDIEIKNSHGLTIECTTQAGDIELVNCDHDDLRFGSNMGDVTIGFNGKTITGQCDLGDIEINGDVNRIDIKDSKGDIDFNGWIHEDSSMTTSLGDIDIKTNDIRIVAKTSLGDIDIDGDYHHGYYQLGNGSATLSLHTSTGDITVDTLD